MAFLQNSTQDSNPTPAKKKRSLPGTPDPEAEVIVLSPKTLMATNRFLCEICGKGFQRDQNLQLHRRGHNLPWKLRQRSGNEQPRKRVYVCPEKGCVHSDPTRALGDLTGIKKHFCRKHGEKKWKCDKCSKRYAVQSDWKAHSKTCGTREYRCDCGTIFSRRDSFITHRAFCDALAEETARMAAASSNNTFNSFTYNLNGTGLMRSSAVGDDQAMPAGLSLWMGPTYQIEQMNADPFSSTMMRIDAQQLDNYGNKLSSPISSDITSISSLPSSTAKEVNSLNTLLLESVPSLYSTQHPMPGAAAPDMSATALLQKAALMGVTYSSVPTSFARNFDTRSYNSDGLFNLNPQMFQKGDDDLGGETRDFLGINGLCTSSSINGWIESIEGNKYEVISTNGN